MPRPGMPPDWLLPAWGGKGVGAVMTTRAGGVGVAPFDTLNLRHGIGDDPTVVDRNRAVLAGTIGAAPLWLNQVHGRVVLRLPLPRDASPDEPLTADGCVTNEPGVVCAVQVADCLPVLFAAPGGRAVGAAHAGWRGLAGGVLEATLAAVAELAECRPADVDAWLGACIGPERFEVGADVLAAFGADVARTDANRFVPHGAGKWLANLPGLATDRLRAAGVERISGGAWCTVSDPSRFFSYRRDRLTGRQAACVWIERNGR